MCCTWIINCRDTLLSLCHTQEEVQALQIKMSSVEAEKENLASKVKSLEAQLVQAAETPSGESISSFRHSYLEIYVNLLLL